MDDVAEKLYVVVLENLSAQVDSWREEGGRMKTLTANSPTSVSSIPMISSSSDARRCSPGMKLMNNRMMQVPQKE